jgi:hypothetical protein
MYINTFSGLHTYPVYIKHNTTYLKSAEPFAGALDASALHSSAFQCPLVACRPENLNFIAGLRGHFHLRALKWQLLHKRRIESRHRNAFTLVGQVPEAKWEVCFFLSVETKKYFVTVSLPHRLLNGAMPVAETAGFSVCWSNKVLEIICCVRLYFEVPYRHWDGGRGLIKTTIRSI